MNLGALLLILATVILGVSGQVYDQLFKQLMRGYQKEVRPSVNLNATVPVRFNLQLIQVDELNKRFNFLRMEVWLVTSWEDPRLSWDPSVHDDIDKIALPETRIWVPDISLYNGATAVKAKQVRTVVYYDGSVFYYVPATIRTPCKIFSGEPTTCSLKFSSWVYNGLELDLSFQNEDDPQMDLADYNENLDYEIVRNKGRRNVARYECCPEPYIDLMYSLTFEELEDRKKRK